MDKKNLIIIAIAVVLLIIIGGIVIAKKSKNNEEKNEIKKQNTITNTSVSNEIKQQPDNTVEEDNKKGDETKMYDSGIHHATLEIKNYGTIELELDADTAPITVANFAKLVNEGFYNGLTFHRIIDGFMIQGGDPLGNGMGGSEENIKGEFRANGVKNDISHKRGVISMARSSSFNSASSQFFIMHKDSPHLDGQYAAFGKVLSGMEIVDKICKDVKVEDSNGTVLKANQPIIEKIVMKD